MLSIRKHQYLHNILFEYLMIVSVCFFAVIFHVNYYNKLVATYMDECTEIIKKKNNIEKI